MEPPPDTPPPPQPATPLARSSLRWAMATRAAWVAGLALALSSFMGWYSGTSAEGPTLSVLGWNTGTLGKLVFVVGTVVVVLAALRELGVEMPRSLPESVVTVALGTMACVFVLIRVISIPDELTGTADRAVGLWVALIAAVVLIVSGLVAAAEEL